MSRTAMAKKRRKSNFLGYVLVAVVILLISFVFFLQSREIKSKLDAYAAQEETLDTQIAKEQARTEEIEEYAKYVQTKAYAGEQAQEKLGLVRDGEIVFRME